MTVAVPALYRDDAMRIALIASSYRRLLGRDLVPLSDDPVAALWDAPLALVAHGVQADPVFFFGNRAALAAFDASIDQFTAMPSRFSAESPLREERQALLDRVTADGFIDDYRGIRISTTGRRFEIAGAVVWNLVDEAGVRRGQAGAFAI